MISLGGGNSNNDNDGQKEPMRTGATLIDLDGIAFSGLKGALAFTRLADPSLVYSVQATDTLENPDSWTEIWTSTGAENQAGPVVVPDEATLGDRSRRFLRTVIAY